MIRPKSVESVVGVRMEFSCIPDELVHIVCVLELYVVAIAKPVFSHYQFVQVSSF